MASKSTVRELVSDAESNVKIADKIAKEFIGWATEVAGMVVVEDGADRWCAESDDYWSAAETVVQAALNGDYDEDHGSQPYDDLCTECRAIYSRIGSGKLTEAQTATLLMTDYEDDAEELADLLLIDLADAEVVYVVRDAGGEYLRADGGRTPASNEAAEYESREAAESACDRASDRVICTTPA